MASNNYIYKMSNAGGLSNITRYVDMLAGNTTWNPWEPAGAYDALATVTVPSGGAANITFAGIPSGYKHLQLRGISRTDRVTATDFLLLRLNSDSTSANYTSHNLFGTGSGTPTSQASVGNKAGEYLALVSSAGDTASVFGGTVIDILDYASTSKYKTTRALSGYDSNGSGLIGLDSGLWLNTAAVNSVTLLPALGSNFAQHSTFALYGIK